MSKNVKKTINENGDLVDVIAKVEEHSEVSDIKVQPIQKKKAEPKEYVFQLTGKFYTNSQFSQYPENFLLKNTDVIYDEETNTERNIRYLEGVSTIYEDEQEHLSDAKKIQRPDIRFAKGFLRVPSNKPTLIKFLTSSNMFDKKTNRMSGTRAIYTMLDFEEQEEREVAKTERKMEAMKMAMEAPVEVFIPHAKFVGIKFVNGYGVERSERAIRVDYLSYAEKNPETFIKTYNNPLVKVQYLVSKAMQVGMIDLSTMKGQAVWGDTKKFIAQIPDNKDTLTFLSEFSLTEKGKEFYAQLKTLAD
jgi:hypothetical protein